MIPLPLMLNKQERLTLMAKFRAGELVISKPQSVAEKSLHQFSAKNPEI